MVRASGSVFRVPAQKAGAMACCAYCDFGRFFPANKRKKGSAFSRAKRGLEGHVKKAHPDKAIKVWVPGSDE